MVVLVISNLVSCSLLSPLTNQPTPFDPNFRHLEKLPRVPPHASLISCRTMMRAPDGSLLVLNISFPSIEFLI